MVYIYIYNGKLLNCKKEGNFAICDNMDGSRGHNAEGNKSEKDMPYDFPQYLESYR